MALAKNEQAEFVRHSTKGFMNSENIGLQFLASGLSKSGVFHAIFVCFSRKPQPQIYELLGDHQVWVFRYERPNNRTNPLLFSGVLHLFTLRNKHL